MPHLRYLNVMGEKAVKRWQIKGKTRPFHAMAIPAKPSRTFHLGPENWEDVDFQPQPLSYNEIATKMNWHYLKVKVDLAGRRFIGFQCNDRIYAV